MDRNAGQTYDEIKQGINRLVELYNKLDGIPFDVGGDVLFPSELNLIEAIGKCRGDTVTTLGEALGVTKGAVSQVAGKLKEKGYIEKRRSSICGKEIELRLTDKGSAIFKKHDAFHKLMDAELQESMERFSREQIEELKGMIDLICKYIEKFILLKEWKL